MKETRKDRRQLTVTFIHIYLFGVGGLAALLAGYLVYCAVMWPDWAPVALISALLMGLPGFSMLWAHRRLRANAPDATRWIRWASIMALPLSALMLLFGVGLLVDWTLPGLPLAAAGVANLFVLLRVGLSKDLDELLWERTADEHAFDEGLNFVEEEEDVEQGEEVEEVELGFVDEGDESEAEHQAAGQVEVDRRHRR